VNRSYMLIRAIRGPVLLIALGILLLMQRFTDFSLQRSWPILVILFGVLKLSERAVLHAGSTSGPGQTPPAGGSWT
jgi:hypothetical protein